MYQILICSVLYSIVTKKKVWSALENFFFVILPSAKDDTRQTDLNAECAGYSTRQIRFLPSARLLALGKEKRP